MPGGVRTAGCAAVLWFIASAAAQDPRFSLDRVATAGAAVTFVTHAGDGSGRLFIVLQRGEIRVLHLGEQNSRSFLGDSRGRVSCCGERGLLSVAFPPGFAGKRHFYVYYTDRAGDIVVSRFRLAPAGIADEGSETVILTIPHRRFANHNGGQLAFGPDGYLYIGTGDGGGAGDPLGSGQDPQSLLGKLLRIDVEGAAQPYGIPPGNPFAGRAGFRPEIWALGLRNPWRFSFDTATGDLYIADVGQNLYEEVNMQPATSAGGENYGWNLMEGMRCFRPGCSPTGLTLPVVDYGRAEGCSVTGGYVYRQTVTALQGLYIYGDYCSGRIWGLRREGGGWTNRLLLDTDLAISTFGQDQPGNLYVVNHNNGDIYLLADGAPRVSRVVDAASFQPAVAPGGLATAFGSGVAPVQGIVGAAAVPWPVELGGVRVRVNGVAAPIVAVANVTAPQVNFQIPWETPPGRATVTVEAAGLSSPAAEVEVPAAAPAIFTAVSGGEAVAAALRANYESLAACTASMFGAVCPRARAGEIILLFATGLGAADNRPADGAAGGVSPLSRTLQEPAVTIGGQAARVFFSGLAPGFPGVYQLNVEVPPVAAGTHDIVIRMGGRSSEPAKLRTGG